jgi:WD40 repeat protein
MPSPRNGVAIMRLRALSADDIFISYSRTDAATYAFGLADALTKEGFTCFLDRLGAEPGRGLPDSMRRKIRACSMLVVIGTELAGTRQTIEEEIKEFLHTGHRSSVVPIDFGGVVTKARWYSLIEGVALEPENDRDALAHGNPSPSVISRIEKQFNYTRRNERLRRLTIGTAALLTLLIFASAAAAIYARRQIELAREAGRRAEQARAEASAARVEAEAAKREAASGRSAALMSQAAAETARGDAAKQKLFADKAAHDAAAKARLADLAERRAAAAAALARSANLEAVRQQTLADSRLLANRSQTLLRQHPEELLQSVSLAVEAVKKFPTAEADAALRRSLALLPRVQRSENYVDYIGDIALSPDGRHFATLTLGNMLRVYESDTRTLNKEVPCPGHKFAPNAFFPNEVALSNDAAYAAVLFGNDAMIFDLRNDRSHVIKVVQADEGIAQLVMSPGGKYLAVGYTRPDSRVLIGARVLEAESARVVKSFADDLDISISVITFGPSGDLAFSGLDLLPPGDPSGLTAVRDAWHIVIWPLSAKLRYGETGRELTDNDFARPIVARLPYNTTGRRLTLEQLVTSHLVLGSNYSIIATGETVWQMNSGREYEPIAHIPATMREGDEMYFGIKRMAFNREGTRLTIITPTVYRPSLDGEWPGPPPPGAEDARPPTYGSVLPAVWRVESWDTTGHRESARTSLRDTIWGLEFKCDDQRIAAIASGNSLARFFRAGDGMEVNAAGLARGYGPRRVLAVSHGFDLLVAADNNGTFVAGVCEPTKIPIPYAGDVGSLITAAISSDGQILVLVGLPPAAEEAEAKTGAPEGGGVKGHNNVTPKAGATAFVFRLRGGSYEEWRRLPLNDMRPGIGLSPDGRLLGVANLDMSLQVWDTVEGRDVTPAGVRKLHKVAAARVSPDGQFLVDVDIAEGNAALFVRVWRLADGKEVAALKHGWTSLNSSVVAFSHSGRQLLDVGFDEVSYLLDLTTGRARQVFEGAQAWQAAAFSRDDRYLAVGTLNEELLVYKMDDLDNEIARLEHTGQITAIAFSDDNRRVATASSFYEAYPAVEEGNLMRVWLLQPEDLIREASERLSLLPQPNR